MIPIVILVVVLLAAVAVGMVYQRRAGRVRPASEAVPEELLHDAGARTGGVTVLHFSADWCGPCAAVRRVVSRAVASVNGSDQAVFDLEVDIDRNPALAKALGVMSLPTTFILGADLTVRSRIAGVPAYDELESALQSLLAS